jgi:restriction system protein
MSRGSTSTFGEVVGAIIGIAFYLVLSGWIGDWLNKQFQLLPSHSLWTTALGACVLLTFGLGALATPILYRRFLDWHQSWIACPHGVAGGKIRKRCDKCLLEQSVLEENARREQEYKEHQQRINADASKLQNTERLRLAKSLVPSIAELRLLSWQQFEDQVARMFERMGYSVQQTPYVKDHGRDAILRKNGAKFLLECKRYAEGGVSGRRDLQILHSNMITDGAVSGFFVTAGGFTKDAIEFAKGRSIELIDGHHLVRLMFDSKPASDDDTYRSMCRQCGKIVLHRLRTPRLEKCGSSHDVAPTLDIATVLTTSDAAPICECGAPMRLVHWKQREFWGCTRYPRCRYTRSWRSHRGLGGQFSGKNDLNMGLTFDPDTYAKAKPLFLEAAREFAGAYKDITELAKHLVDEMLAAGNSMDVLRRMRPYLEAFIQEVKSGTVTLGEAAPSTERREAMSNVAEFEHLIRKHWTKYLPAKVRALRESGQLEESIQGSAKLAQDLVDHLMQKQHYREHEAKEVALHRFVYLKPEAGAGQPAWERKELAKLEREYQRHPPVVLHDDDQFQDLIPPRHKIRRPRGEP